MGQQGVEGLGERKEGFWWYKKKLLQRLRERRRVETMEYIGEKNSYKLWWGVQREREKSRMFACARVYVCRCVCVCVGACVTGARGCADGGRNVIRASPRLHFERD